MNAPQLPTPLPDEVESPRAKLVYLYLQTTEGATVEDLEACLDLPRITLLSVLKTLRKRDVVERDGNHYVPTAADVEEVESATARPA